MSVETTWPKISIVTPSFNQGKYIEETILSIIDQKYPNLEYIIIDGGSTDETLSVIKKYEHCLKYWISQPDNGQYDAINKGFSQSSGEIMGWLNSDDKLLPGSLFTIAEIFITFPHIHWITSSLPIVWNCYGQPVECPNRGGYNRDSFYNGSNLPESSWFAQYTIQQESTFWKRSLWDTSGGMMDNSLKYAGDFDLWLRFFQKTDLYSVQTLIGGFRKHHEQKTSFAMQKYIDEGKRCLESHGMKPYGMINSRFRNLLKYSFLNNPCQCEKLPRPVLKFFEKSHILFPAPVVFWSGDKWEVKTNYIL